MVLLLIGLGLAGCGNHLKDKIVGTWMVDPSSISSSDIDHLNADPKGAAQVKKELDASRFEFKSDGTVTVTGDGSETGSWNLDGYVLNIEIGHQNDTIFMLNADGTRIHVSVARGMPHEADLIKIR
jgi:hypothetical protein